MSNWTPSCKLSRPAGYLVRGLTSVIAHLAAWASKPIKQDVSYEDKEAFQAALQKLQRLPPLVTAHEVCPFMFSSSRVLQPEEARGWMIRWANAELDHTSERES